MWGLRLRKIISSIKSALAEEDVIELNIYLITELYKYLMKEKGKSIEDYSRRVIPVIEELEREHPFPMIRLATNVIRGLIHEARERTVTSNVKEFKEMLGISGSIIREYIAKAYSIAALHLASILKSDSSIFIIGYFNLLERLLLSTKIKIRQVNMIRYWPYLWGLELSEKLVHQGFNVKLWYDSSIARAIEDSEYVIIPVWGVSTEGYAVGDAGSQLAVDLAESFGVERIALALTIHLEPGEGLIDKIKGVTLQTKVKLPNKSKAELLYKRFDLIPTGKFDKIVTDIAIFDYIKRDEMISAYMGLINKIINEVKQMYVEKGWDLGVA